MTGWGAKKWKRKQHLRGERTRSTEGEKERSERTCGEREAGKMSITLTLKQSSLFRRMSQGRKHDPTFKHLSPLCSKSGDTHTVSHTLTAPNFPKRFQNTKHHLFKYKSRPLHPSYSFPSDHFIITQTLLFWDPSVRLGQQITYQYLCCLSLLSPPPL